MTPSSSPHSSHIDRLERELSWLRASGAQQAQGTLVLDGAGRVLHLNAAADALLFLSGLAVASGGRVRFVSGLSQDAFAAALAELARHDARPRLLPVAAADEGPVPALVLHLAPLPYDREGLRILATVTPLAPPAPHEADVALLQTVLGLSRAEARAALALHRHHDTSRAAAALNLRPGTVRVHMKTLHARLKVCSNSELVLLVERALAGAMRR